MPEPRSRPRFAEVRGARTTDRFFPHVRLFGGPAPVRRCLLELLELVMRGDIEPGKVFDLTLPLDRVAGGQCAMDVCARGLLDELPPSHRPCSSSTTCTA